LVFPTKYRQIVINDEVDKTIKDACLEIAKRYEVHFVEMVLSSTLCKPVFSILPLP